ncbi:hypothetical protein P2318_20500 [Myxococcaceae bacterium GXIMD 01537]
MPRLLWLLLAGTGLYVALRLGQVLLPEQFPSLVTVWLTRSVVLGIPVDFHEGALRNALLPWGVLGGIHVVHGILVRRVAGGEGWSPSQGLALSLFPGVNLVGSGWLLRQVAEACRAVRAPRRLMIWAAVGLLLLGVEALGQLAVPWLPKSDGAALVASLDGLLLAVQAWVLLSAWRLLSQRARQPPESPEVELELSLEDVAEPPAAPVVSEVLSAHCPECAPPQKLVRVEGRLGAHCPGCAGDALAPQESARLLAELAVSEASFQQLIAEAAGPGRAPKCPVCAAPSVAVVLRGATLFPCTSCRSLWLRAGVLHGVTRGQHGEARRAPVRPAASPPSVVHPRAPRLPPSRPVATAMMGALVLLWGAGYYARSEGLDCSSGTRERREPWLVGGKEPGFQMGCYEPRPLLDDGSRVLVRGLVRVRDARGRLREERLHSEVGARNGPFRTWDAAGRLREEGWYTAAVKSGIWRTRDASGGITSETHYTSGRATRHIEFFPGQGRSFEVEMRGEQRHGAFSAWYPDGAVAVTGQYVQGVRDGDWKLRDVEGNETVEHWSRGRRQEAPPPPRVLTGADAQAAGPTGAHVEKALYGGREVAWWGPRLRKMESLARDEEGKARYALALERARANGLIIEETAAGLKVIEPPRQEPVSESAP